RLDAISTIYEDPSLTPHNVPMNLAELRHATDLAKTPTEKKQIEKYWKEMFVHQLDGPGLHDLMKELRAVLDEYDGDRMLVGEDDHISYMGDGNDELNLVFNFPLMWTERITPAHIRRNQKERLTQLNALPVKGWPCNTLGNHDCSRIHTRYGDRIHDAELARLNAALVLTLRGTPFLYNGEEIGMTDLIITDPTKLRDTMATWYYDQLVNELKVNPTEAARRAGEMSRDKNRTPMQWSETSNGGFSPATIETWLPVNPNFAEGINVAEQRNGPASLLNYYKRLIHVRKSTPALIEGEYTPLALRSKEYFAFLRATEKQNVLVVLNYSENRQELKLKIKGFKNVQILFSSAGRGHQTEALSKLSVGAFEVLIAELQA
ncbi:MAG TPA: alpha-amylase family glycosyl hydrolase, partial [Anaerolineales bacterium]|nr:alpha-amylase family glycosyl hydrolase [Anaerolineales bacterium]